MDTVTTAPENARPPNPTINSKPSRGPLAKHWAGCTKNNYTDEDIACFKNVIEPLADYYIYGLEVSESGTPHIQFMVCFKTSKRLTAVNKLLSGAHWEMKSPNSTMHQASSYCKKEGKYVEFGTLPDDKHVAGLKKIQADYDDTLAKAKAGKINEIAAQHQVKYYSTLKRIEHDSKKMPDNLNWTTETCPNVWIWGSTGIFKLLIIII